MDENINHVEFAKHGHTWSVPDAFYRISIKLIIKDNDGRILVQKRLNNELYELPGGGLDWGEDYKTAIRRELTEETNLSLDRIDAQPFAQIYSQHRTKYHALKIYYTADVSGTLIDNEPHKIHNLWVDQETFRTLKFQTDEKGILEYTDTIWPTDS